MYASLANYREITCLALGTWFLEAHDTVVAINNMTSLGMWDGKETRIRFYYLASPIEAD
jgi:hypothetical protein